ncbi:hypothetical protein [Pseudomonas viridiflava]|uniref:hypothetical protein n=1 Tax=Pseudomonas viridiflava TaxID=33069 RepID=UPI001C31CADB|nr:hypothetical protein [Pseudomonas viridiflava]QXG50017.1 hypothetical protein KTT57_13750 [Pseudomonas viridiflava]
MGEISLKGRYPKQTARFASLLVLAWSGAFADSAVASDKSSGTCIAEADFRQGSSVETQTRISNAPGVAGHNKTETLGRQSFAGAYPLMQAQTTLINNAPVFTGYAFVDLVDGKLIRYGNQHGSGASLVATYNEPPPAVPIDLQPGQTVTVSYRSKTVTAGPGVEYEITEKHTYIGRETITTPLGTFDACKFTNEISSGLASSKDGRNLAVIESWFASAGQYRGRLIKTFVPAHGGLPDVINETIKVVTTSQ